MATTYISCYRLYGGSNYMIEIFEIFWSSPIELRVIILGGLISPFILLRNNNDKRGLKNGINHKTNR